MILAARKHLFATNIFFFIVIFIIQKCIRVFCFIEEKACNNSNCPENKHCDERCIAGTDVQSSIHPTGGSAGYRSTSSSSTPLPTPTVTPPPSPIPAAVRGFRLIPGAMRQKMHNFGFGEGHYQIFVEEKQRQQYISKSRLNAAVAEVKLNPN